MRRSPGGSTSRPGVEQHTRLEILAAAIREPGEAPTIARSDGNAGLDLDTPGLRTPRHDHVQRHPVLVAVVPEPQIGIGPGGLGDDELLNDERLLQCPMRSWPESQ